LYKIFFATNFVKNNYKFYNFIKNNYSQKNYLSIKIFKKITEKGFFYKFFSNLQEKFMVV